MPRTRDPGKLRVGAHTSIADGVHRALLRGEELGCDVVQIFVRSNQQWATPQLGAEQLRLWRRARRSTRVAPALVHGSYLVNLAAPSAALRRRSCRALAWELGRAELLGIPHLVLHPGAHGGDGERAGVERVARALARVLAEHPGRRTTVLLENTAGQGSSIGYRFEHLRDILASVPQRRVGVCLDTCHALAAGYDLRTRDGWQGVMAELDATIGCGRVRAVHANDSKAPLGSRLDRHEHVGRGRIGLAAFHCLVNDPLLGRLPLLLETPKPTPIADLVNLAVLRALHGTARVGRRARRLATQPLDAAPG